MSLLDVVRSGVAIADKITKPLQPEVQFYRFISSTGSGDPTYASPVTMRAVVDWKQKHLRTSTGQLTVSRAAVMFLDIKEVVAATAGEGIGDHDKIVLPDGTTGPIIDMGGFIDASTGHPVATEVWLG